MWGLGYSANGSQVLACFELHLVLIWMENDKGWKLSISLQSFPSKHDVLWGPTSAAGKMEKTFPSMCDAGLDILLTTLTVKCGGNVRNCHIHLATVK